MNCQLSDSHTVNGVRPVCAPAVARLTHHHGGTTALCQHHLNFWFDDADDNEASEPAAWSRLAGPPNLSVETT